jgi:hypothetical protein
MAVIVAVGAVSTLMLVVVVPRGVVEVVGLLRELVQVRGELVQQRGEEE